MENERTCFICILQKRCYAFKEIHEATKYGMNIDSNDTPGTIHSVFIAVANACLDYTKDG
jgi:hypothetical protein